ISAMFALGCINLALCKSDTPFCVMSLNNLDMNFNSRLISGSVLQAGINSIKLKRIFKEKNQSDINCWNTMLCTFDEVEHLFMVTDNRNESKEAKDITKELTIMHKILGDGSSNTI